jgi:hypothetical protein
MCISQNYKSVELVHIYIMICYNPTVTPVYTPLQAFYKGYYVLMVSLFNFCLEDFLISQWDFWVENVDVPRRDATRLGNSHKNHNIV